MIDRPRKDDRPEERDTSTKAVCGRRKGQLQYHNGGLVPNGVRCFHFVLDTEVGFIDARHDFLESQLCSHLEVRWRPQGPDTLPGCSTICGGVLESRIELILSFLLTPGFSPLSATCRSPKTV
jgi:hypothetical protein